MKRTVKIICTLIFITTLFSLFAFADFTVTPDDIIGTWYGEYTGVSGSTYVQRYMHMTITNCDENGKFSGTANITAVAGQGYENQWVNYYFDGYISANNGFNMQGHSIITSAGGNWRLVPFNGKFSLNADNELFVEGIADNNSSRPFYFARTSKWAQQEIMEANIAKLIPDTLLKKDLSKPVTRAEFAAISTCLYSRLTNTSPAAVSSPFTDIDGNENKEYIQKAYGIGITTGVTDELFSPDTFINREQVATMLCRTVKAFAFDGWTLENDSSFILDTTGVTKYEDDADISDFAKQSVYYLSKHGIITGIDDTHFAPKNITKLHAESNYATATREQAIVLSLRIYKNASIWK